MSNDPLADMISELESVEAMLSESLEESHPPLGPVGVVPVATAPDDRPVLRRLPSTDELADEFDALLASSGPRGSDPALSNGTDELSVHDVTTATSLRQLNDPAISVHEEPTDTELERPPPDPGDLAVQAIHAEALYQEGRRAARAGHVADSIAAYRRCLALRGDHSPAILALALALSRSGEHSDAAAELERLLPRVKRESERQLVARAIAKLRG